MRQLRILALCEYRQSSPNYNIAVRLFDEMRKNGVEITNGYLVKDIRSSDFNGFSIQSEKTRIFWDNKFDHAWFQRSPIVKLKYLLFHPRFLKSYLWSLIDGYSGYRDCKSRIENICSRENYDCILGISAPHEIEKLLNSVDVTTPKIVLRLDPYTNNPDHPFLSVRKSLKDECVWLSNYNKLFTTKIIIDDLLVNNVIKKYSNKLVSVEFPLISEKDRFGDCDRDDSIRKFEKKDNEVYLLHAGLFYKNIRNPQKLVRFLKLLPPEYKLIVAGPNTDMIRKYDSEVRDRIIDIGLISRTELQMVIDDCDFLVSYNNLNTNMIPSKLFECIDSAKPFINLCQTDKCPTIDYVKGYDMAFTVMLNDDVNVSELLTFLKNTLGRRSSRDTILRRYEKCTPKYVANQLLEAIDNSGENDE